MFVILQDRVFNDWLRFLENKRFINIAVQRRTTNTSSNNYPETPKSKKVSTSVILSRTTLERQTANWIAKLSKSHTLSLLVLVRTFIHTYTRKCIAGSLRRCRGEVADVTGRGRGFRGPGVILRGRRCRTGRSRRGRRGRPARERQTVASVGRFFG